MLKGGRVKRAILAGSILISFGTIRCYADGLGALVEVGKNMSEIQSDYTRETKAYEGVKKAVDNGTIREGQAKHEIRRSYGEPIIVTHDPKTNREKWAYKPASSTFFDGPKIYLYFGADDILNEIAAVK